jgi:hypothetical protein
VLLSANPEFSFLRYALPCYLYAFAWMAGAGRALEDRRRLQGAVVVLCLGWALSSSMRVFPESHLYFNELAGGPKGGYRYIQGAEIVSRRDAVLLEQWYQNQPVQWPLRVDIHDVELAPGLRSAMVQKSPYVPREMAEALASRGAPLPVVAPPNAPVAGWYAVGAWELTHPRVGYGATLRALEPVARIGNQVFVYFLTSQNANSLRQEFGLPPLP